VSVLPLYLELLALRRQEDELASLQRQYDALRLRIGAAGPGPPSPRAGGVGGGGGVGGTGGGGDGAEGGVLQRPQYLQPAWGGAAGVPGRWFALTMGPPLAVVGRPAMPAPTGGAQAAP
jgi:hypothetical protein